MTQVGNENLLVMIWTLVFPGEKNNWRYSNNLKTSERNLLKFGGRIGHDAGRKLKGFGQDLDISASRRKKIIGDGKGMRTTEYLSVTQITRKGHNFIQNEDRKMTKAPNCPQYPLLYSTSIHLWALKSIFLALFQKMCFLRRPS